MLTNLDYKDRTIDNVIEENKKSIKLIPTKIIQNDIQITKFEDFTSTLESIKETIKNFDYKEKALKVYISETQYYFYDADKETIIKQNGDIQEELGCGKIVIKATYKKATKKTKTKEAKKAYILITVELTADYQKDYEIVSFNKDEIQNQKNIDDFMKKYITKPFVLLDNTVGVEINFNKIFYKPEKLRPLANILSDIKDIDDELKMLEDGLGL